MRYGVKKAVLALRWLGSTILTNLIILSSCFSTSLFHFGLCELIVNSSKSGKYSLKMLKQLGERLESETQSFLIFLRVPSCTN